MPLDANVRDRLAQLIEWGELPLPVLPEAVSQVLSLMRRPRCDVNELASVIRRDANLTAHLLQVAASPAYGGSVRVTSIAQIITRLGFATVFQLTLAIASGPVYVAPGFERELREAFRHAFATALFAQEIARHRRSTVDSAFIAGLLHDIGRPVLIQALVDLYRQANLPLDPADAVAEAGVHHARAGEALALRWAVVPGISEAVRRHHAPDGHELAHVVALADAFAHDTEPGVHPIALNLYPEDLDVIASKRQDIMATVEAAS